jgi:hypothetical protein
MRMKISLLMKDEHVIKMTINAKLFQSIKEKKKSLDCWDVIRYQSIQVTLNHEGLQDNRQVYILRFGNS